MRTYEFTCARCGQTVKESTQILDACPEYCQACLLEIQARTDAKLGVVRPPDPMVRKDPQTPTAPMSKTPAPPPKPAKPAAPQRPGTRVTIRLQPTCPSCKGRGKVKGALCPDCNGSGVKS
ncbi:MAG: hypothetical protein WC969_04635 [Elusimicrobiota bacterium]|jgi:hypothetical protein